MTSLYSEPAFDSEGQQRDILSTDYYGKDKGAFWRSMNMSSQYSRGTSSSSLDNTSKAEMRTDRREDRYVNANHACGDSDDDGSKSSLLSNEVYMFSRKRQLASQLAEHDRKVKEKRVRLMDEMEHSESRTPLSLLQHGSTRPNYHRVPMVDEFNFIDGRNTPAVLIKEEQAEEPVTTCCGGSMWEMNKNKIPIMKPFKISLPSSPAMSFKIMDEQNSRHDRKPKLRVVSKTLAIGDRTPMIDQDQDSVLFINNKSHSVPSSPVHKRPLRNPPLRSTQQRNLPHVPPIHLVIDEKSERTRRAVHDDRKDQIRNFAKERKLKLGREFVGIPSNHRYKFYWDVVTVFLPFISAYTTHLSIRDRTYEFTAFTIFTQLWFGADILLNFISVERNPDGTVSRHRTATSAKYLTTWFPIDALSIYPWEHMLLRPIIERQNRRNLLTKWFFRSKATVRVTRILRGRHFKFFGRVANTTKRIGVGGKKLLALIIKYVPKYLLFYRNMKAVIVLKVLRQIHFVKKIYVAMTSDPFDEDYLALETDVSSCDEDDENSCASLNDATTSVNYFVHNDENRFEILLDGMSRLKMCKSD